MPIIQNAGKKCAMKGSKILKVFLFSTISSLICHALWGCQYYWTSSYSHMHPSTGLQFVPKWYPPAARLSIYIEAVYVEETFPTYFKKNLLQRIFSLKYFSPVFEIMNSKLMFQLSLSTYNILLIIQPHQNIRHISHNSHTS